MWITQPHWESSAGGNVKENPSLKAIPVAERTRNLGQMDRRHMRGLLDEKDAFLQTWGDGVPSASSPTMQSSGASPAAGVRDPLPFPAPPWNHRADGEIRRLQGSAFCIWAGGGGSIVPKATRPVDAEACLKSICTRHRAVTPREGEGTGGRLGRRVPRQSISNRSIA